MSQVIEFPSVLTHNGTLTVVSGKTGSHRTFKIKTQPADAKFKPGSRIISMMTGPDNEVSYESFGEVTGSGINVWFKKRAKYDAYASMLSRLPYLMENGKADVMFATTCRRCNRKLTSPESISSGIGPQCSMQED